MLDISDDTIIYVSHSGGKDSQAMYNFILRKFSHGQIVVVHADLGEVEWAGVQDHIRENIAHPLNVVRAGKTFFDMVRHRARSRPDVPCWPSSSTRQCTSDLKRGPIEKFIRNDMKRRGATKAINAMGLRAEESPARSKKKAWQLNKRLSRAGRVVHDWLPIHELDEAQVFDAIRNAGQRPFWAYAKGNKRLSCVFCIMGCKSDLANGKKQRHDLYKKIIRIEEETGWTMFPGKSLSDVV